VNFAQLAHFQRLLSTLGLHTALANTLADWIDADSEPQPQGGAEDESIWRCSRPTSLPTGR